MFLKVFKYDFKAVLYSFLPVLAILPIISIVVRIVNLISANNVAAVLLKTGVNGMFGIGCVFLFVYTTVICIVRYVQSLFRSQGYLTHTLPVSKHSLLLSHLLVDFIMQIFCVLLILLCVLIGYVSPTMLVDIVYILGEFFHVILTEQELLRLISGPVILGILSVIFSSLQSLFVIYTGVALGHAFAKNKGILSVVFCIAINYGLGIILGIANMIFGYAIFQLDFETIEDDVNFFNGYLGINLAESILICVGAYFLDIFLMKKHLNLE